ncbi:conserved hypothetical protein [Ricinus communis]|uniref:Uncharacterized protein n=1 Tax=Ricinus communis TaxID=3988 RepID=B9RYP1_RICCO|nr:conserved hypothetical protein [Ricinus communis]
MRCKKKKEAVSRYPSCRSEVIGGERFHVAITGSGTIRTPMISSSIVNLIPPGPEAKINSYAHFLIGR